MISIYSLISSNKKFRKHSKKQFEKLKRSIKKFGFTKDAIDDDISITCIALCNSDIEKYNKKYDECLQKACNFQGLQSDFSIESSFHNIISVALIIEFGNLKILLGGDVVNESWHEIYKDDRFPILKSNIVFLKAPHHGSNGAYNEDIWNNWGKDFEIIISPYNKAKIPKAEILEKIMTHSTKIKILKDKSRKSVFGDSEFLVRKLALKDNSITTCPDAAHHIRYDITKKGDIIYEWIKE